MFKKSMLCLFTLLFSLSVFAEGTGKKGPATFQQRTGEGLYEALCQSCHMPEGKGAHGAGYYPALSKANSNMVSSMYIADITMYGRNGMPGFGGLLDDEQVTEIVNYVRTHFGNDYKDALKVEDVNAIRVDSHEYVDMD